MLKKYSNELKLKAVSMYADGVGAPTIAKMLGVKDKKSIYEWHNTYKIYGKSAFEKDVENIDLSKLLLEFENRELKKFYKLTTGNDFGLKKK